MRLEHSIIVLLAGWEAETTHYGVLRYPGWVAEAMNSALEDSLEAPSDDVRAAREAMAICQASGEDPEELLIRLQRECNSFVVANQDCILRVAGELEEAGRLTGDDVRRIVGPDRLQEWELEDDSSP